MHLLRLRRGRYVRLDGLLSTPYMGLEAVLNYDNHTYPKRLLKDETVCRAPAPWSM